MKPLTLEDLGALTPTLARAVSNVGTYHDHLTAMSELNMLLRRAVQAAKVFEPPPKRVEKPGHARVGSFVTYWDPKKGLQQAHVLEVHAGERLKLRVHQAAKPDYEADNVPYSEKPQVGHWSYR